MDSLAESIRHRLLAAPDSGASLALAVKAELPWLEPERISTQARSIYADFYQLGVLTPLFEDPRVTDVLVNAPDEIWVVDTGAPRRVDLAFPDESSVRTLAARLAALAGRQLDDAHPYVDMEYASLRIHALLPPLASRGTAISIRRIHRDHSELSDLVADVGMRARIRELLESRQNFLISGGTGSGKTTLLGAMVRALPTHERVIIVEDTLEIVGDERAHHLSLQTRVANAEDRGAVSMRDLVRQTLRMRPDRIIVGEVRGAEIVDLLAALNTGHAGSGGTVHARDIRDVPARIEALAVFAGLPAPAAHSLLLSSIDAVIHLRSARDGRGIAAIGRVVRDGERAVVITEDGGC
jgi:pilus assembly protein CpaF